MTLVNNSNSEMLSKIMILSNFVIKQLMIEHIYDLSINSKDNKFGACIKFHTLILKHQHSYYILPSGSTGCNQRWPIRKV